MKLFFAILLNALLLYGLSLYFPICETVQDSGCLVVPSVSLLNGGWQTYLFWGIILGILNLYIRPILKIIGFPFRILSFGLFILVIDAFILLFFDLIIARFNLKDIITYEIRGFTLFIIIVAIFTIFNTLYQVFFKK